MRTTVLLLLSLLLPLPAIGQGLPSTYPSHYLAITPADSVEYGQMYSDEATRDSIRAGYSNAHRAAKAIERYALKQQSTDFLRTVKNRSGSDRWEVTLTSGDTIQLNPRVVSRSYADLTFEYYYPEHKLIVFRSQWTEGNGYVLVSRVDGESVRTFGPPVFSPSGKWFIAFNEDTIARYSPNGLQVFRSKKEPEKDSFDFKEVLSYRMDDVGPTRCRWTGEDTFRMEVVQRFVLDRPSNYEHYRVTIREPGH